MIPESITGHYDCSKKCYAPSRQNKTIESILDKVDARNMRDTLKDYFGDRDQDFSAHGKHHDTLLKLEWIIKINITRTFIVHLILQIKDPYPTQILLQKLDHLAFWIIYLGKYL